MTVLHIVVASLAAVVFFMHGLQGFSQEIQNVGGKQLQLWLERFTASKFRGFIIGACTTAIVQSSSAITSLTVTLVSSRTLSFWNTWELFLERMLVSPLPRG
ncbi:MAG: Na/Pi symporter [Bacteroidota bacterium]|nr:Na/Pi symporter [Candidatus Kapabacteria bacterium]MDW8219391.1 Na/Pi symporter [Bacteroidota bacterium]